MLWFICFQAKLPAGMNEDRSQRFGIQIALYQHTFYNTPPPGIFFAGWGKKRASNHQFGERRLRSPKNSVDKFFLNENILKILVIMLTIF